MTEQLTHEMVVAVRDKLLDASAAVVSTRRLAALVVLDSFLRRVKHTVLLRVVFLWREYVVIENIRSRRQLDPRARHQIAGLVETIRDMEHIFQRAKLKGCLMSAVYARLTRAIERWRECAAAALAVEDHRALRTSWREWQWFADVHPFVRACLRLRGRVEHYRSMCNSLKVERAHEEYERLRSNVAGRSRLSTAVRGSRPSRA